MAREIKFRYIWRRIADGHLYANIVPIQCLEGKGDVPFSGNDLWELVARSQCTGLRDENGVEVYEGDVIRLAGDYDLTGKVWYDETCAAFCYDEMSLIEIVRAADIEIIGNIYENPELLDNEVVTPD